MEITIRELKDLAYGKKPKYLDNYLESLSTHLNHLDDDHKVCLSIQPYTDDPKDWNIPDPHADGVPGGNAGVREGSYHIIRCRCSEIDNQQPSVGRIDYRNGIFADNRFDNFREIKRTVYRPLFRKRAIR